MARRDNDYQRTLINYVVGFLASLALTFCAYVLVSGHILGGITLLLVIGGLALVQMLVQLLFFLHMADESRPRFRLVSFGFMAMILVIVVAGSLWIMYHLNYNMMGMSPSQKDTYMTTQKDKGF
ncbi:MAG: cyoD [Candidatus Saccharibacteria bacterium]|nr:cyoD [Candidatus Saccharibacteria bacterium]